MNGKFTLTIPGEPVAKARPRVYGNHAVTPAKTVNYEVLVKEMFAIEHHGWTAWSGALAVRITAYFGIPKSASKAKREQMVTGIINPTKRPDFDNLAKIVCDALNGIAWADDSQITDATIRKRYSTRPRVELVAWQGGANESI